ncbi:MAG: NUMOD3 domain-containing DNA-binding protein [Spirochaetia bacterium]|jgi:hypothetical protein|nr:NUMOD3 domain-containing DNA-binding protein [Spirochaetia bacterium]
MARVAREFVCKTCNKKFKSINWKPDKDPKYCSKECQHPKRVRTCPVCGKQDKVSISNPQVAVCCSIQCGNIWKNKNNNKIVKCDHCGIDFKKPNSQLKDKNYCSEKCRLDSFKETWLNKVCHVCGEEFKTRQSREATYCSNDCNLRSEERKENLKEKYTGVSLLDRGYTEEKLQEHINRNIERNKSNTGQTWKESFGEETAKKMKEEISIRCSNSGNPMSYESIMERFEIDSYEEARELMPATGRNGELHPFFGKHHSIESKKQMMDTFNREGVIRWKNISTGSFDGVYFQGTWELKYIIDCINNGVSIRRFDLEPFLYYFEGSPHHYFPDFIVNNDTTIEIKGYDKNFEKTKLKMEEYKKQHKENYKILYDVGQNQNPKTFLRNMKNQYQERLVLKNNPYQEKGKE